MKRAIFAVAIAALPFAATAQQTPQGGVTPVLLGLGGQTCQTWTTERARNGYTGGLIWMEGFITSFNITGLEPSKHLSNGYTIAQVGAQMDMYCQREPNLQIGLAARNTISDLIGIRGRDPRVNPTPLPPLPKAPAAPQAGRGR